MSVLRSAVCERCSHRQVEHAGVGLGRCNKYSCRCRRFVDSGLLGVVLPAGSDADDRPDAAS